jgi:hypothetical protein
MRRPLPLSLQPQPQPRAALACRSLPRAVSPILPLVVCPLAIHPSAHIINSKNGVQIRGGAFLSD